MTPTLLQKNYGMSRSLALQANCLATLILTLGCILFGYLTDRLGTRLTMAVAWGGLALTSYIFYLHLPGIAADQLLFNYGLVGLFCGAIATIPIVAVRAFPPAIRFSGLSFSYNVAYAIFGGLTPAVTQLWLQHDPMAPAYYVITVSVLAIGVTMVPLAVHGWRESSAGRPA